MSNAHCAEAPSGGLGERPSFDCRAAHVHRWPNHRSRQQRAERRKGKRADYILRYRRDFPIAVVEAKAESEEAAMAVQQAKEYAEILKLRFAYGTNGRTIIEFDFITGLERGPHLILKR